MRVDTPAPDEFLHLEEILPQDDSLTVMRKELENKIVISEERMLEKIMNSGQRILNLVQEANDGLKTNIGNDVNHKFENHEFRIRGLEKGFKTLHDNTTKTAEKLISDIQMLQSQKLSIEDIDMNMNTEEVDFDEGPKLRSLPGSYAEN